MQSSRLSSCFCAHLAMSIMSALLGKCIRRMSGSMGSLFSWVLAQLKYEGAAWPVACIELACVPVAQLAIILIQSITIQAISPKSSLIRTAIF